MNFSHIRWLFLFGIIFISRGQNSFAGEPKAWLAYGDLRGNIEPCGCDPETDLGGIRRLAAAVQLERLSFPELLSFDLGNDFAFNREQAAKNKFILEAQKLFRATAILMNQLEIKASQSDLIIAKEMRESGLPYVLSNLKTEKLSSAPNFTQSFPQQVIKTGNNIVLGYVYDPTLNIYLEKAGDKLLKTWKNFGSQQQQNKTHILLFSGTDEDLDFFVKSQIFDLIISANRRSLETLMGTDERHNENLLIKNIQGHDIYSTPLGAQGFIRGGELRLGKAKTLNEMLSPPKGQLFPQNERHSTLPFKLEGSPLVNYTWLDHSYQEGAPLKEVLESYYKLERANFSNQSKQRLADLEHSEYAGVKVCKTCHEKAAKIWEKSKHQQAFVDLKKQNKHEVSECVNCHAVGARERGGFVDEKSSAWLAAVQCENCHGPRKKHVQQPLEKKFYIRADLKICLNCHNSTHSPKFEKTQYWNKIKH